MIARRLLRAAKRTFRRLAKPLRLRYIDHKAACSISELQRIAEMRHDLLKLEHNEHFNLVRLGVRREQIVKGMA